MCRTDLRLGEIVYVLVFYNIAFSWLFSLNGLEFIFLWRDSENDLFQKAAGKRTSLTRRKADSSGYQTNFHSGNLQEKGRGPDRRLLLTPLASQFPRRFFVFSDSKCLISVNLLFIYFIFWLTTLRNWDDH